jgi:hypothetical protein
MRDRGFVSWLLTVLLIVLPILYQLNSHHQSLMQLVRESQADIEAIHNTTLQELEEMQANGR